MSSIAASWARLSDYVFDQRLKFRDWRDEFVVRRGVMRTLAYTFVVFWALITVLACWYVRSHASLIGAFTDLILELPAGAFAFQTFRLASRRTSRDGWASFPLFVVWRLTRLIGLTISYSIASFIVISIATSGGNVPTTDIPHLYSSNLSYGLAYGFCGGLLWCLFKSVRPNYNRQPLRFQDLTFGEPFMWTTLGHSAYVNIKVDERHYVDWHGADKPELFAKPINHDATVSRLPEEIRSFYSTSANQAV